MLLYDKQNGKYKKGNLYSKNYPNTQAQSLGFFFFLKDSLGKLIMKLKHA